MQEVFGGDEQLSGPTVHVVDDHGPFLVSMSRWLRARGFGVETYTSASDFLVRQDVGMPGCVIADLQMPDVSELDLQLTLAHTPPPLPILFLTDNTDAVSTVRAMRGGAEDVLEKRAPKEVLLDAIRRALARDERERGARARRREMTIRFESLTGRERSVLAHVLEGRLNKQIANDLGINERTVKVHRKSIMTKVDVRSVATLTLLALEAGIPMGPVNLNEEGGAPFPGSPKRGP
jgi:FixJ family two-component response regulator